METGKLGRCFYAELLPSLHEAALKRLARAATPAGLGFKARVAQVISVMQRAHNKPLREPSCPWVESFVWSMGTLLCSE